MDNILVSTSVYFFGGGGGVGLFCRDLESIQESFVFAGFVLESRSVCNFAILGRFASWTTIKIELWPAAKMKSRIFLPGHEKLPSFSMI